MDNGYRALEYGEVIIKGDELSVGPEQWQVCDRTIGGRAGVVLIRRPIAHYATPTEKVVEHALDATANAPDEWNGEGWPVIGAVVRFRTNHYDKGVYAEVEVMYVSDQVIVLRRLSDQLDIAVDALLRNDQWSMSPIETQSQIEERERKEGIKTIAIQGAGINFSDLDYEYAERIYDWLKSTDQLKDKSDD